jgi:hypothetical protein
MFSNINRNTQPPSLNARRLGHPAIYLNAADATALFYEALGWQVIERSCKEFNIMQRLLAPAGE